MTTSTDATSCHWRWRRRMQSLESRSWLPPTAHADDAAVHPRTTRQRSDGRLNSDRYRPTRCNSLSHAQTDSLRLHDVAATTAVLVADAFRVGGYDIASGQYPDGHIPAGGTAFILTDQ